MSSLMPDVSLDEEASGEKNSSRAEEKKKSSKEESTSEEEQKISTEEESARRDDKAVPNVQVTPGEGKGGDKSSGHESSGENDQSAAVTSEDETVREDCLDIYPSESPDLSEKLGLLVSTEVEEALDDAYLSMRMVHGKKAKKSLIVEAALRFILSDYQQKGKLESEISSWLDRVAD